VAIGVVTDSLASIPRDDAKSAGVEVVSLHINDGDSNVAELELDVASFYRRLEDMRVLPTSSQPSVESLAEAFRRVLTRSTEALGVFCSSKMSGTIDAARIAADIVLAEKPGARIELLDSGSNSMAEGFGVLAAASSAMAGEGIERCIERARQTLGKTRYLFTPETLEYLRRGGRIGRASALLGNVLQIKPILTVEGGEVTTFSKVRTRGRALAEIARVLSDDIAAHGLAQVIVHYIGDPAPAEQFAREHIEPLAGCPVRVIPVSPVIGLHVGPAVGIVYETERGWS
jgi:DegV family protein with EDD domain